MGERVTYHIHIVIKDALTWPDRKIEGMLCDADKRVLSVKEIRGFLQSQLDEGFLYFSACDNRKEDGSCAGHPYEEHTYECDACGKEAKDWPFCDECSGMLDQAVSGLKQCRKL